jgi:GNAT superfamily N-acetyltransferase
MAVRGIRAEDRAQVAEWKRLIWDGDDGEDPGETVWVWESADTSLGGFVSATVRAWADGCSSAPVPYVEGWYVREDLRRTGVGRALIAAVERWARSAGFTEIGSDAQLDNTVSLRAHRRLGFRPTERLQFFCKSLAGSMADAVRVEWYAGSRARLRPLFALAEDSPARLDSYLDAGRVLVATSGDEVLGHLQLVATGHPGEAEITNMAVREDHQGTGIGGGLLTTAIAALTDEGGSTLWVGTASADIDNLRFYQRHGFRMRSVERDAFTIATGYPPGLRVEGIDIRDRVWLDRRLDPGIDRLPDTSAATEAG